MIKVLSTVSLLILISCGKGGENPAAGIQYKPGLNIQMEAGPVLINDLYMAKFKTLNGHINGVIPGSATIQRSEDKFIAYVRLFSASPSTWHQQFIHVGKRCPGPQDDINQDGFIDIQEALKVVGKILIPLDSNITSQRQGRSTFPVSDETGSYFYERSTSYSRFMDDLLADDIFPEDNVVKLLNEDDFTMAGKAVLVLGASDKILYPETVASADNYSQAQTLPIACGVFSKVTEIPGESDDGIPGPVAPATPGMGAPAGDNLPLPGDYAPSRPAESWGDRVIDWWRNRWRSSRGERRPRWGIGRRDD